MTRRLGLFAVSVGFAVVSACGAGITVLGGAASCGIVDHTVTALANPPALHTADADWNDDQIRNAATIVAVGASLGVPARGWVIAVATAMQETTLTNTPGGDRDSVGLFQQRPSQGWGSPQQLLDPAYAAGQFYHRLLLIPGWQSMPLTHAAQAVQHSATPHAYAKWEADATTLVTAAVGSGNWPAHLVIDRQCPSNCPEVTSSQLPTQSPPADACQSGPLTALPAGFSPPPQTPTAVATAISWGLRQLGTPYSYGGDCTAPHSGDPTRQCDCSSLVQQAYRAAGISLPRTAAAQSRVGTLILDTDQLQPGDLLFIPGAEGTPANPGHVGMYLGDGLLLESPQAGEPVRLAHLTADWLTELTMRRVAAPGRQDLPAGRRSRRPYRSDPSSRHDRGAAGTWPSERPHVQARRVACSGTPERGPSSSWRCSAPRRTGSQTSSR